MHPTMHSPQAPTRTLRGIRPTGILLSNETLQLPGGRLYRNGDLCPDGNAGQLRFLSTRLSLLRYRTSSVVPRDGDLVRIEFAPAS
jgi:hypothetical protein